MKKLLAIVLCITLFCMSFFTMSYANDKENINGIQEKLDALFMRNNFTQSQTDAMYQDRINSFTNDFWSRYLPGKKALGKMETASDEEEYALDLKRYKVGLDFENGLLVSLLSTNRYAEQYAKSKDFSYLFSGEKYWLAGSCNYLEDGTYFADSKKVFSIIVPQFATSNDSKNLLKNADGIETLLLSQGESVVSDIKLFAMMGTLSFLYIECEKNEYLIKLFDSTGTGSEYIPQIELLKLYPVPKVMDAVAAIADKEGFVYGKDFAKNVIATKPTFITEAESLQQSGILNGNENGLDLLKPLTRIEAAAMLLRAIGEPETAPNSSIQTFSDVPKTHWGYGAAERAASEGIINGVGDGQFVPEKAVTATEFATMVLRAAETGEFDWQQALKMLIKQGIITQENADTMDLFTRGDMAKMIYEARIKSLL